MIYSCPNCMAALVFNPTTGKLDCLACGSIFDVTQFEDKEAQAEAAAVQEAAALKDAGIADDIMECNIYSCTACGAELAVNGVETSTFCSYCGQPTIVFSRVSSARKPHYIIPFSVNKEQAITLIRNHLNKGYFIPKEIRDFSIERVRGIYIPYWLYDISYEDRQYLKGRVGSGKNSHTAYFYRAAKTHFHNLTLDGSQQLHDESSQRLEPFLTKKIVPFETSYLTGFYADCFDMNNRQLEKIAAERSRELFNLEVQKTIKASNISIVECQPQLKFQNVSYAMFPAWFLTFRYQDEPYTILVNGQTEKVVGAVPFDKPKVTSLFILLGVVFSLICIPLAYVCLLAEDSDVLELLVYACIMGAFMWGTGFSKFKSIKTSIGLSKSSRMTRFVKDRQEG